MDNFAPPSVGARARVPYRLRFERGRQSGVAPDELRLRLCRLDDVTCARPIDSNPAPDASGLVELELDPAFQGYLEVEAPDLMPSLVFLPPLVVSPPEVQVIRSLERFEFAALLLSAGIAYDDERGFAIVLTNSCLDQRAADVVLSTPDADAQTIAYYYRARVPDADARQTDAQGAGGWSRLPPGTIVAEARRALTEEPIGVAEFLSRPGSISYVPIGPTAAP